jgi:hypothetical protein
MRERTCRCRESTEHPEIPLSEFRDVSVEDIRFGRAIPCDTARASKYYTELVYGKIYGSSEDADSIAVLNVGDRRNRDDR